MLVLDVEQLEGVLLLHQQQVVAGGDGERRQGTALDLLAQQLGLAGGVEEADGTVLGAADEALAKVLGGQQVDRAIALEVADLGELALAILRHFEPLGDDAVVVAHQQGRGAGEQLDLGHVGVGGVDLHDVAQGDVAEVVDVIDRQAVAFAHEQDAQVGGQQHLIHVARQGGNGVVLAAPLHFAGEEVLLAAQHRHHATTILGHGGGGHLVLGRLEHHALERLALGIDHHGLLTEGILQAGFDDAHVVGIGDLEVRLDDLRLAIGKAVGDQLLTRGRRRDRGDLARDLGLAQHLTHLEVAIVLHGEEADLTLIAEAITDLVLLFDAEPGGLALHRQGKGGGRFHAGAIEDGFHHIEQIEEDKQQGHQYQTTACGDPVLGQLVLDPAFSTARHDQVDRFR
ncbi:hypothetical protein D3C85_1024560 [compost metagenome]